MKTSILFSAIILSSFTSAQAMDCPVKFPVDNYLEEVASAIEKSTSCWEASQIAEACALGASGDAYTVPVATNKCLENLPAFSKKDQETFDYLNNKCNEKYANIPGTLYISMNAFCHLSVAELFNSLLTPEN